MASGGSVIALKYNGGVLMAADTLLSYGSLAKWPNIPRIKIVGSRTAVSFTGDFADFQDMANGLGANVARKKMYSNVDELGPEEIFCFLHRKLYDKRSNFEPCLCQFVLMGYHDDKAFLGGVDDIGTRWEDDCVATGYGAHIALPLLRQAVEKHPDGLTREEAVRIIEDCLRVLFYRECRSINKFQIAEAKHGGVEIGEPFSVDTNWDLEGYAFDKTAIIR